jgi:hypothetical protein
MTADTPPQLTPQKYLILADAVIFLDTNEVVPKDISDPRYAAYLDDAFPSPQVSTVVSVFQQIMDTQARQLGYDDIRTAVTYADEPVVPRFQAEGIAFRKWRSQVWGLAYMHLDQLTSAGVPVPKFSELLPLIPSLELDAAAEDQGAPTAPDP